EGQAMADRGMATFNALDLDAGYGGGSLDHWQPEQEVGTRLADEPGRQVVLLCEREGELGLWAGEVINAVTVSQDRLRERQVAKLADLSSTRGAEWECLQQRYRTLAFATQWIATDDL